MEYLLDVRWTDPVAKAMGAVLSALPDGVEQTTASIPGATSRGFMLLRADDAVALEKMAETMIAAGADVRIVPREAA